MTIIKKTFCFLIICSTLLNAASVSDLNITKEDIKGITKKIQKNAVIKRLKKYMSLTTKLNSTNDVTRKLILVNNYYNSFKYVSDYKQYKKNDYWATRKEFILKGRGDCEDFAIAKYFTLINAGIDKSKLSLVLSTYKGNSHIVLVYKDSNRIFYLDNNSWNIKLNKYVELLYRVPSMKEFKTLSQEQKIIAYKWDYVLKRSYSI